MQRRPRPGRSRPSREGSTPRRGRAGTRTDARAATCTRSRREEGVLADGGSLVVDTGHHTGRSPNDKFVVREARLRGPHLVGQGQPAARGGALRGPPRQGHVVPASRDLYVVDAFAGADPKHRIRSASSPTTPTTRCSRGRCSSTPTDDELEGFVPGGRRPARTGLRGGPGEDGTRSGTFIALHPSSAGGADRRHVLRGRDQEVDLHADERPAAARGRVPDALLGERRRRGRRRDLFRPLRHRQDDALGRPASAS